MRLLRVSATSLLAVAAATAFAMPVQAAPADSDRDGMPNSWETKHKLNPRSKADASADPDGDRLTNIAEYRVSGNPRDEDTDNDGQDDGDESATRTKVNKADSDGDRVPDGDEDADHDGISNEDEDDAAETCAGDDDDTDRDYVADEDEDELGLRSSVADSDADGTTDGTEDSDNDGMTNEDEDDNAADSCSGDRDGDGEDDEDKGDRFGTITSFDPTVGVLVVITAGGYQLSAQVTKDTEIKVADERRGKKDRKSRAADADKDESGTSDCDADEKPLKVADADKDESGKDDDCDKDDDKAQGSTDALVTGAVIKELELHRKTGAVKEIKLA